MSVIFQLLMLVVGAVAYGIMTDISYENVRL